MFDLILNYLIIIIVRSFLYQLSIFRIDIIIQFYFLVKTIIIEAFNMEILIKNLQI